MKNSTVTTEKLSVSATRSISRPERQRAGSFGKRSAKSSKKANRHVVLELNQAPTDVGELSKMLYDTIDHYHYLICPHKSDEEREYMNAQTIFGIIDLAKTENELFGHTYRAFIINKINFYRKMIEFNHVDDHTVGYNPAKTRWMK